MNTPTPKQIALESITTTDRLRPVDQTALAALAADIKERGLRSPIEVAKKPSGEGYVLVSGAHRLAAVTSLGWKAVPAFLVKGNKLELRRDEILENLARAELTKLERAQFLAELKRVYLELYPETAQGKAGAVGRWDATDKMSVAFVNAVADRAHVDERTIYRAVWLGEMLQPAAAEALRGTPWEDNQAALIKIASQEPKVQPKVAEVLTRTDDPPPSVPEAVGIATGTPLPRQAPKADQDFSRLIDAWDRAAAKTRRQFIDWLAENGGLG
ncbi:MAG: ParB N-terminal domain-containing protein [Pseudomonadota bacterium]